MCRLLRENTHQLFKWTSGLSHLKLYVNFCAIHKIRCKWGVMEWIIPIPTLTAFIVIGKDPLKSFNITLLNFINKLLNVVGVCNKELISIIPHFPAINTELDFVNIGFNFRCVFSFSNSFSLLLKKVLSKLKFFLLCNICSIQLFVKFLFCCRNSVVFLKLVCQVISLFFLESKVVLVLLSRARSTIFVEFLLTLLFIEVLLELFLL